MDSKQKVECPVCNSVFKSSEINQHIDECLKSQDQTVDQDVIFEKSENRNRKRKSDSPEKSGWGFLKASSFSTSKKTKTDENIHEIVNKNLKITMKLSNLQSNAKQTDNERKKEQNLQCTNISNSTVPKCSIASTSTQNSTEINGHSSEISNTEEPLQTNIDPFKPLAEQMRPTCFDDYIGHDKEVGGSTMLGKLLQSDTVPSMVLWGPPGCGKTTLARVIAHNCKRRGCAKFVQLSAAAAGVNDVKEVIKIAKNDMKMFHKKTILFLDEIHRFNKTQQDALLPHVEDGSITLIGATTENPSFQVNSALLSRCRVIVLDKLSAEAVEEILLRAVKRLGARVLDDGDEVTMEDKDSRNTVLIEKKAVETLSHLCDGDARVALNGLQMAIQSQASKVSQSKDSLQSGSKTHTAIVRTEHIKEGLQKSHLLYDRAGEEHYNIISALHKSMRGSDDSAALYWLARMLEGGETPLYVARRLVRFASEDIGLADPLALNQSVAAYQACHFIGMPECEVILAQCVVYLSRAPKSVEVYQAYSKAKKCVKSHQGPLPSVPLHLRNAPTKLMKDLGYSKGYKYNPSFSVPVDQEYFPEGLKGTSFFK